MEIIYFFFFFFPPTEAQSDWIHSVKVFLFSNSELSGYSGKGYSKMKAIPGKTGKLSENYLLLIVYNPQVIF